VFAPLVSITELLAGLGAVAALLWVVDDPDRPPGGLSRGATTIAIPALAVGIAWSGAVLLPNGTFAFGIAAVLLVVILVAIAFLVGRPDVFDQEEAATSYAAPR
jgi:hypothetical protein